jgi:hypothetical protein
MLFSHLNLSIPVRHIPSGFLTMILYVIVSHMSQ